MFPLIKESLILEEHKQLITEKLVEFKVPQGHIDILLPFLMEDSELLNEFLGKLAGKVGSSFSGLGSKLQNYSKQQHLKSTQKSRRSEHRKAVMSYAKSLKSGDTKKSGEALNSLRTARMKHRSIRNLNNKLAGTKAKNHMGRSASVYRRLAECLIKESKK